MSVATRSLALCASALLGGCNFTATDFSPIASEGGETAYFAANLAAARDTSAIDAAPEILRSPDGLFYADALVNGVPVRFVVDSGSSLVVFSRKDADRTGVSDAAHHDLRVKTAGGTARMRGVSVRSLNIDGRSLDQVEAAIAEDFSGTSLLGQSALSRLDGVTFSGERLRFR